MLTSYELQKGQVIPEGSTAKKINSLLNSPKTRFKGLELLNSFLPQCPDEDFIKFCVSWMQNCCKADGFIKNRNYSARLLSNLFEISSNYQELKKSVSFFITTRYFDYFFKHFLNSQSGWTCTETCLLFYRGACGPFQGNLENHLTKELEKKRKIMPVIARCWALFPCIGGGGNEGINYKKNWKSQFNRFLSICHSILNDLFADVEELQEYGTLEHTHNKKGNERDIEYLATQFHNHCTILSNMLLNRYPTPKTIPSDLIFELICRGLAVSPKALAKRETTDVMSLRKVLPEIHCSLFFLLKAVVVTCKNQLLPYSHLICTLMKQSLEWTESEFSCGTEKPFGRLRISVYESLCNWLIVARHGSCIESISSVVVSSAVNDIKSEKEAVFLKDAGTQKKSKNREQTRRTSTTANRRLCYAALKALQFLLKFSGVLLKPELHKYLQEVVVKLLIELQKCSAGNLVVPFAVSACRTELYSLLLELVHQPSLKWPPPTNYALRLFSRGVNDSSPEVSSFCSAALNFTTVIIHPQYDNGGFPLSYSTDYEIPAVFEDREDSMETENVEKEKEDVSQEQSMENSPKSDVTDLAEKISEESELSSNEDSINTIRFTKDTYEVAKTIIEMKTTEEFSIPKSKPVEEMNIEERETPAEEEPVAKQPKILEVTPKKITPDEKIESTTPKKRQESSLVESWDSPKIGTPESVNEENHTNKRYFLRSQTKASSEEPEEGGRKTNTPDSVKCTPCKSVRTTPVAQSARKRRRTRNLSKVEEDSEKKEKTSEENCNDDVEDIKAAFDDSFLD